MATNSLTKTFTSTFVPGSTVTTNVWIPEQPQPTSTLSVGGAAASANPSYWNGVYGPTASGPTNLFNLEAGVTL